MHVLCTIYQFCIYQFSMFLNVCICSNSRCLFCQELLLEISYTFENVGKQFLLKMKMTCDNTKLIYIVNCPICKEEYIGETWIGNSNSEIVSRYIDNIFDSLNIKKCKVAKHLRTCGKGKLQNICFYYCIQMTQIFDGNMKITL